MSRRMLRSAILLLAVTASCRDMLAPPASEQGAAARTIDVSVATVALDIIYNGASIGQGFGPPGTLTVQGDRCFNVTVDGTFRTQACGKLDVQNLTPGPHTIGLQDMVPNPGSPLPLAVDVSPPVAVTLVGGTSTPVSFDISAVRGQLSGVVQINGAAPPDFQYNVCLESFSCSQLTGGIIALFARPGSGVAHVRTMMGATNILDIPYTAVAGETVDLGTFNVVFGSLALDILYDGASIGPSFAPPGQVTVQGERCFQLFVDGVNRSQVCGPTTVADLPPGDHAIALRELVPVPGNPMGTLVDVQPPQTVTVTGGASTPVAFDITGIRGKLTGTVQINGAAPPDFQYNVCLDSSGCSQLTGGTIALFVRPGAGVAHVRTMMGATTILDIPFTAVAGETVALGTLNVEFGSVALDILYNGASIGPSFAPPGQLSVQGERCFQLFVDGVSRNQVCGPTTVGDIVPGNHTVALRELVPVPGNPIGTFVDVQPPLTVTVTGGASVPAVFDITAIRGKIAGQVRINGAPPPDFQYQICIGQTSCGQMTAGSFVMFARLGSGQGSLRSMMPFATLAEFTFIVAAGNTTLIGGVSTAAPGSTPPGSSVSVLPVNQTTGTSNTTVELTFDNVSSAGTTTVVQSNTGSPPPSGLQLGDPPVFFNITTTATFTGPVEVCINYTGTTFDPGAPLELLHGEPDGSWTIVTTSHNTADRIICGSVTSFSPFVVARRTAAPAVPPSVTPTVTGTLGAAGWYTSSVSVSWNVSGNGTPVTGSTGCEDTTISSNTDGLTLTCTATSAGGTTSQSVTIRRDATAPVVTPAVSGLAGDNGWYRGDVTISWSAADPTSGLSTPACATATLAADSPGATYSCSATNGAGLTTTATQTVKRDATNPVVSYSGNAGTYSADQAIAIDCAASDATSGLAASSCENIGGAAYTFGPGATTRSASATDRAGNSTTATVTFTVVVTTDALCRLAKEFAGNLATSLCAKLDAAAAARARGSAKAADNQIDAFLKELRAQSGKGISAEHADILIRLASAL